MQSLARQRSSGLRSRWDLALLLFGAAIMLFPFAWMALGSFKTMIESNAYPPHILPNEWDWSNFSEAWNGPPGSLGRYFGNTIGLALSGTLLQLFFCSLAAYALAIVRIPGRNLFFALVLGTMLVPGEVTLIPNFVTIRNLPLVGGNDILGNGGSGLYDTYLGQLLPGIIGAFNIFLLRQAFMQIPRDLWEASQIDGSTSFCYLWQIVLPLAKPTLTTLFLLGFVARWNALLWPMIVTRSESIRPVQLAMIWFQGEFDTDYGVLMAAAIMVTLPIIAIFLVLQRQFVQGITSTGLKG